jgi:hypothetical protein
MIDNKVAYLLKAKIMKPEETSIATGQCGSNM